MTYKRVSVLQIAAISAAGHAFVGVLCVWLVLAFLMFTEMPPQTAISDAFASVRESGVATLMLFPLAFAVIGFASGMVACHVRNLYVAHCCPSNLVSMEPQLTKDAVQASSQVAA